MPIKRFLLVPAAICVAATMAWAQPKPDLDKDPTLYIVGYAHLDTQWRWAYPQVIREFLKNTLHDNFKLIDRYPNYVFNFTGAHRYMLMKEYYPEDYARMKKYIAAGRWFPAGSSMEEGDVNSPSLESIIRHVLYGNEYFEKEFGKTSEEYMLPDCFGFPAALPSILAHCGIKGFSTQKLTWGSAVGIPFNVGVWQGPDGKSIVAALNCTSYGSHIDNDLTKDAKWLQRVQEDGSKTGVFADYRYYGTGDVGGAPEEDSVKWADVSVKSEGPLHVVGGNADQMFKDLSPQDVAKLPVYRGDLELTEHSAGSLNSEAIMKKWNHDNEKLADAAEKANSTALALGAGVYPSDKLFNAWTLTTACQFHDMLPGTCIPQAYVYAYNDESIAMNEFSSSLVDGVGAVAKLLDTSGEGMPLVVYNPLSVERNEVVDMATDSTPDFGANNLKKRIFSADGHAVPTQRTTEGGKSHILFSASVPALGYAVYYYRAGSAKDSHSDLNASERVIENEHLRVTVNEAGDVSSIFDKDAKRETLQEPIRLALQHENPKNWPSWNMDWDDQKLPPAGYVDGPAKITIAEKGTARVALQIERDSHGSHYVQQVRLAAGSRRVEFADSVDWHTPETALKATFPLKASNSNATYNWQIGTIERGNNDPKKYEVACQQWFDVTDASGDYGASVLTREKHGSDKPSDNTVRLTLLYTPGTRGGYQDQGSQDWGHHELRYSLLPHSGDWRKAGTPTEAMEFDQPMIAFEISSHPGLGKTFSFAATDQPNVSIVAVKKAEDGNNLIVRLRENNGQAVTNGHIRFAMPITGAKEVDGQERVLGRATVAGNILTFNLSGYGVGAYSVGLQPMLKHLDQPQSAPVDLPYNLDGISSRVNRRDGDFDGNGHTYPGDQLPEELTSDGIKFKIGPHEDGESNMLVCQGQTLKLPPGEWDRIYVLAASSSGDPVADFKLRDVTQKARIANWGGYVGEWDTRVWKGPLPETAFDWHNELLGIEPGFEKHDEIAWRCSHRHNPTGDDIYQYSYLFKYGFDLTAGTNFGHPANEITLPNNPNIKIAAISVARNVVDDIKPLQPLYDTLKDRHPTAPAISPSTGAFKDATLVALTPGLYGSSEDIRYSLNGGAMQTYSGPFRVYRPTTVRAELNGLTTTTKIDANDVTRPSIVRANALQGLGQVQVRFSEPVSSSTASNPANYKVAGSPATSARLLDDGVTVNLSAPLAQGYSGTVPVTVSGVADLAPQPNVMPATTFNAPVLAPSFQLRSFEANGNEFNQRVQDLPKRADDPWTINLFVRMDKMPEDLTPIAGFGRSTDDATGASRYICKFDDGIHFWGRNVDIGSNVPFDLGAWQMVTATFDGKMVRLYKNGKEIVTQNAQLANAPGVVKVAPLDGWDNKRRFVGQVKNFTIWPAALDPASVATLYSRG